MKRTIDTLVALATLGLTQPALGSITVHFVQEGADVRVSFSGSIAVDSTIATDADTTISTTGAISGAAAFTTNAAIYNNDLGAAVASGIATTFADIAGAGSGIGYNGAELLWRGSAITGGAVGR